jgi:hypothetical protein
MIEKGRADSSEASDRLESSFRIGCGALIGIFVGAVIGTVLLVEFAGSAALAASVAIIVASVCAFLAWRHGDRFFYSTARGIRSLLWWL